MVVNINDYNLTEAQENLLLHATERLNQGSSKRKMAASACAGIIVSSNKTGSGRLTGRVTQLNYHDIVKTLQSKAQLEESAKICERYKGFLVSWVIIFGELWDSLIKECQDVISRVFSNLIPKQQQRWYDSIAITTFTKYFYLKTLNRHTVLSDEIRLVAATQNFVQSNCFIGKLEKNIRRLIKEDPGKVLRWLNWQTTVERKTIEMKDTDVEKWPRALAIKATKFNKKFRGCSKDELKKMLIDFPHSLGISVKFAKKDVVCSVAQQQARDAKLTQSLRAHKIPLSWFSIELVAWFDNGDLHAEITEKEHLTAGGTLSDEDLNILNALEEEVTAFMENVDASAKSEEEETESWQAWNEIASPCKKQRIDEMSPHRKAAFLEGFDYARQKCSGRTLFEGGKKEKKDRNSNTMKAGKEESHSSEKDYITEQEKGNDDNSTEQEIGHEETSKDEDLEDEEEENSTEEELEDEGNSAEEEIDEEGKLADEDLKDEEISPDKKKLTMNEEEVEKTSIEEKTDSVGEEKDDERIDDERDCQKKIAQSFPVGVFGAFPKYSSTPKNSSAGCSMSEPSEPDNQDVQHEASIYCLCKKGPEKDMIECSGRPRKNCPGLTWFHFECLGMTPKSLPPENQLWYCKSCQLSRKNTNFRKRRK